MPTDKTVKKHYHHGDLHQQLLSMAAVMIREDGEAALSMRKIAERLGVSRMAPYHHFADKQALLCGIAENGFALFMTQVMDIAQGPEAMPPSAFTPPPFNKAVLERFVRTYIGFAVEHREYYDLMFGGHLWQSAVITDDFRNAAHTAFKAYVDVIRLWHQQGLIATTADPLRYAQFSWSTLHGMSRLLIDGIYVDQTAIDTLCRTATDNFWTLIQPRDILS